MVAKITVPHSIERALNYNEKKMQKGIAECIHAHNYLKEARQLNYYEKLQRFQQLISLNDRANTNTIHISLNFDITEKLEKENGTVDIQKAASSFFMSAIFFFGQYQYVREK